jgi:putative cardiolipin synthase
MSSRILSLILVVAFLAGCSTLPPGSDFPKTTSVALVQLESTRLGRQLADAARAHGGLSGFRLLPAGVDGFLARAQMANTAERTLDLQYFILRGDETGQLLADGVLRAADRGVRIRILVDDGETIDGDEQIHALDAHPKIEVRIFNPFAYRGHNMTLRAVEFMFNSSRLDYRMHNKLLVADNAIALVGGRNIGDQYFQIDPESQLADDDVFATGPIVKELSETFDDFWNNAIAIPVEALATGKASAASLAEYRKSLAEHRQQAKADGTDYANRVATGEPLAGMLSGKLPLVWAHAQVVCDSPDKKRVLAGEVIGRLMLRPVAKTMAAVQSELLMVTPYLIPGEEGMQLLHELRQRNVRVRILTNSLESSTVLSAQATYMHYRVPLLVNGVDLHEIRSLLGNARGSGQTAAISRYGNYSLHGKMFVFDRQSLYIGSMNYDQRSMNLNTEVGVIIYSPVLAEQIAARFDAMVQRVNAYALELRPGPAGGSQRIVWLTQEGSKSVEYDKEPARSEWQTFKANILSSLPLDSEM